MEFKKSHNKPLKIIIQTRIAEETLDESREDSQGINS